MKKVLASLILIGLLAVPIMASAQWIEDLLGLGQKKAPTIGVMGALGHITDWLFAILMVIAAIAVIIAAYYFVTAAGDPDKVKTARNFVLYALIGVLVGLLAKGLVNLVARIVGGAGEQPF